MPIPRTLPAGRTRRRPGGVAALSEKLANPEQLLPGADLDHGDQRHRRDVALSTMAHPVPGSCAGSTSFPSVPGPRIEARHRPIWLNVPPPGGKGWPSPAPEPRHLFRRRIESPPECQRNPGPRLGPCLTYPHHKCRRGELEARPGKSRTPQLSSATEGRRAWKALLPRLRASARGLVVPGPVMYEIAEIARHSSIDPRRRYSRFTPPRARSVFPVLPIDRSPIKDLAGDATPMDAMTRDRPLSARRPFRRREPCARHTPSFRGAAPTWVTHSLNPEFWGGPSSRQPTLRRLRR